MTATLTVKAKAIDMSGITFTDATVDYDGAAHSIEIQGTLPAGIASVSYEGNGKTAVGTYTVTASFTVKAGYDPVSPMTATLTVKGKTVDMSGITFRDAAVSPRSLPPSLLPPFFRMRPQALPRLIPTLLRRIEYFFQVSA